jgi:lipopolysaccharide/colanic/teichoic acid biosynthesis glycosyltransferase
MSGEPGRARPGALRRPLRLLEPFRPGSTIVGAAIAALGVVLVVGTSIGFTGSIAIVVGLIAVYLTGLWYQSRSRKQLLEKTFIWRGVGPKADPIEHFAVKFWSGWGSKTEAPPYVRRAVMGEVEEGLAQEQFVLLMGERTSGKSRLIYEIAKARPDQMALVAAPVKAEGNDPLAQLMGDDLGLADWEERQLLVLRDFTKRLIDRRITGDSMRSWLERHPKVSVVATVNPDDLRRIAEDGEEAEISLGEVAKLARVVTLDHELSGEELTEARAKFPELEQRDVEHLPRYMVLEHPLRERFEDEEGGNELGGTLVRAVADWQRAGLARPAPEQYLRVIASRSAAGPGELEAALRWAIEPVRPAARLLYPVYADADSGGYEADRVVIDLLEDSESPQQIPDFTWEAIYEELVRDVDGRDEDEDIAAELLAVGEAAMTCGRYEFARDILKGARNLGNASQEQRSAQVLTSGTRIGAVMRLLVDSRRGDGILPRIREARDLAEQRRVARMDFGDSEGSGRVFAMIYRRRALRALFRGTVLMLFDVSSAAFGLAVGLGLRAALSGGDDIGSLLDVFVRVLAPWAAATVFVFALAGLYRQDDKRARLAAILVATGALGAIGLVAALAEELDIPAALAAALVGTLWAAFCDYRLRVKYDSISRKWVEDHELEAKTLLLGGPRQVAAVERALPTGVSRPTAVCGYLTPGTDDPAEAEDPERIPMTPWLGSIDRLPEAVADHDIDWVLIADHEMRPLERQALADRCHLRRVRVAAIPSPSDIQAGSAEFVAGQMLVLIPLVPLWRGNVAFLAKRAFDFIVALVALVFLSPVLALTALVILIFDGTPIVVRSWRPGAGREVFGMYRFRTTVERPVSLRDPGALDEAEEQPTALGRWLRSHGLDELPQLFNILIGDMSLVGPRPLRLSDDSKLRDAELLRYVVRPGATSPWQVCGNAGISCSELTAMDMAYLRNWTIFADLEILVKTARLVLRGREKQLTLHMDDDPDLWVEEADPEPTA